MWIHSLTLLLATLAIASSGAAEESNQIAGYVSKSHVVGSAIDLDLQQMHSAMAQGDFEKARQIFMLGANADPYAKIHLEEPLLKDLSSNNNNRPLVALGMNEAQEPVVLFVSADSKKGSSTLYVMYNETARTQPALDGCLVARGGIIIENYGAVNYHYDRNQDNMFWSSLYGFSEHEAERMFHCRDKCPYPEYEKFYKYYGQMDYGALWVIAALKGESTANGQLSFAHGQEDFSKLAEPGRMAAVETAAVTMNVRTHVNRIMTEWAIDACRQCQGDNDCPHVVQAWDKAVAHYAGSLVQPNQELVGGWESGTLLYGMADEMSRDFATCGPNGDDVEGIATVNRDIIQQFQAGRVLLEKKSCDMAELTYGQIIHLMTVPLIQGTLRSAYRLATTHKGDAEEKGRGVAFMASILPDLYSCNKQDADIVYDELNLSAGKTPNFGKVKEAFERNYQCLVVTCDDVGGLYDMSKGRYVEGGSPCGKRRARQRSYRHGSGSATGRSQWMLGGCVALLVATLMVTHQRWVPIVSSRADLIVSTFGPRYQRVPVSTMDRLNSLQLTPSFCRDNHFDPSYEMTDHSESSSDYYDMEHSDRSDYLDMDTSDRSQSY